jgi:DNA-binding transcriptional regulator YiaG
MTYTDFCAVWRSALDYTADQRDLYTADHTTQSWTDEFGDDHAAIICVLDTIHDMAHRGIKAIRGVTGLSQQAFGDAYGIPRRTIQTWEYDVSTAPLYVTMMIGFAVMTDAIPKLKSEQ